jgi:phosphonate transport system ATP-binding protein
MTTTETNELAFDSVNKAFGNERAMADVTFRIESGERVAVIGSSGAGKTTLLRLANGSISPDTGTVTFNGESPTGDDISLAYQGETLIQRRTALANVLSGRVGDLPWWRGFFEPIFPRDPSPALSLLDAVGLAEKAITRADALSAGERQRVAFARALIRETPVMLADEPTANLDPTTRASVLDVLDRVVGDRLLVVVLHDIALALNRFDRVIGLADGHIRFDESVENVDDRMITTLFDGDPSSAGRSNTGQQSVANGTDHEVDSCGKPQWYA